MKNSSLKLKLGLVVAALSLAAAGCDPDDGTEDGAADDAAGTADDGDDDGEATTDAGGDDDPATTDAGGDDDPTTDAGADDDAATTDDDGGEAEHVDLFACGLPLSCDAISVHIDPEPPEAVTCASELAQSGEPGVVDYLDTPGPDIDEDQHLTIFLGDGTAVTQHRRRSCADFDASPEDTCPADGRLPWEPSEVHELCTVTEACACDPETASCEASCNEPWVEACEPVDDYSCEELLAALGTR